MKKFKKSQVIVLIISMLFLLLSMSFVIYKNFSNPTNETKVKSGTKQDMTVEYVDTNYEIDLYDEEATDGITLTLSAKYIGSDEIVEEPTINMNVDCYYVYEDAGDIYTDMKNLSMTISYKDGKYTGEEKIDFGAKNLKSYNCAYKITNTDGIYIAK